jgi:hypothetical protein
MSGNISFNPFTTSSPQNTFLSPTQGYMQGLMYDDPVARLELAGGQLAAAETIVMWGGRPILEQINITSAGASDGLGPQVASATAQTNCTGWCVFNQAGSMVLIPGGAYPPVAAVGNYVSFVRYGSLARIAVACDPSLVTTITGGTNSITSQALYWDITNYRITLTTSGGNWALPTTTKLLSTNSTNSKIITYTASQASWTTGAAAIIQI